MEERPLGDLIRDARLRRGWTQEELAARLGVKDSYISQWETGGRKWPKGHVRAISEALGISQVEMAVAAGIIDRPEVMPPAPPDPETEELVRLVKGLDAPARRALLLLAEDSRDSLAAAGGRRRRATG